MKLSNIVQYLELQNVTAQLSLDGEVTGGYTSDLLSEVMGNIQPGNLWITIQTHLSVAAVATLKDVSGIIITRKLKPDTDLIEKCIEEKIPVLQATKNSFEVSGQLYKILNK